MLSFSPPVSVLLGVSTGVAGGILRDVILGEVPLVFRPEIRLYATAAFFGAVAFVTLANVASISLATYVCVILVLGLRLAGIRWKLTLPTLEDQPERREGSGNGGSRTSKLRNDREACL